MASRRLLAVLAAVCCLARSEAAGAPQNGVRPIGGGAYPLSLTHASAWFAHSADNNAKVLTVLFFFQGSPGWLSGQTNWKLRPNETPASINMTVGNVPVQAKYWPETDEVETGGSRYKRSASNVFLVTGIDETNPLVKPLGIHDLTFKPDELPPVTLLKRDADVWAAVTGRKLNDHPAREPHVNSEIAALDAEGLRLLNTENSQDQRKGCELFHERL